METPVAALRARLAAALGAIGEGDCAPQIAPAADRRFGDYQTNVAMVLAKPRRENPRKIAADLVARMEVADFCEPPEIAGAGFINFRLTPAHLGERVNAMAVDPRLGVPAAAAPRTIVVDFSAPNVAKPMHVGHIRSTILGDTLARVARFLGHRVTGDNHIGDWGTQFGKVIYGWKHFLDRAALESEPVTELVRLYRETNALGDRDSAVSDECRRELVLLQAGDPANLAIWEQCVALSWGEFEKMYTLLDVAFDERLGESFYNDRLAPLVERLLASGLAEISEGAACVFFRDNPALADKPCLIRKSDGGYLYATTDLATLEYREERWNPDAVWYVTGAPQALHFQQIFETARRMGIAADLRHVAFGSILGEDRRLMKTRSGDNVQLADLLGEAVVRAAAIVSEKSPGLPDAERAAIARAVGIGAVKYAELSQHRMTDYVFSWEKMLSFQGNTAPYLQNAHVRIRSIFRKLPEGDAALRGPVHPVEPAEMELARRLVLYGDTVPLILEDFRPNLLAAYLYELADAFHGFYEACPVLKSDGDTRASRLGLCGVTAAVLRHGLGLLGIGAPDRM